MPIQKLESCPKCRGHLILEKDNYGLYQQCLQCGYLHDLQTFPNITSEKIEEKKESMVTNHLSIRSARAIMRDTTRLTDGYHQTTLADPLDLRLILDALYKQQEYNRQ